MHKVLMWHARLMSRLHGCRQVEGLLQAAKVGSSTCIIDLHLAWPLPALLCCAFLFSSSSVGHAIHLSTTGLKPLGQLPLDGALSG